MLPIFQQFIKKYGARGPMFLQNAPITFIDDLTLPRFSIVHDLELNTERLFPVREGYLNNGTSRAKRILIHQLDDFTIELEGTRVIADRTLPMKARKWAMSNLRDFRKQNLLELPFNDANSHGIINYNLLKAKYEYKASLYSTYHQQANLQRQFVKTLTQATKANGSGVNHIVQIELPNAIPSYNVFRRFQSLKLERLKRVIRDPLFRILFEWYAWLNRETRERIGLYKDLKEEDASQILLMFKYKGYVTFVPLTVFLSMSDENELKSTLKFRPERLQKFFVRFVLRIQSQIDALLEENKEDEQKVRVVDPELENSDDSVKEENEPSSRSKRSEQDDDPKTSEVETKPIESLDDDDDFDYTVDIKSMGLFQLDESDDDAHGSELIDEIFNEDIDRADDIKDEEIIYDESYFTKDQEKVLEKVKDQSSEDRFRKELSYLHASKSISSTEHRQLLKAFNDRQDMTNPYTGQGLVNDFVKINTEDVRIPKEQTKISVTSSAVPEGLKQASLNTFDKKYVNNVMRKDIVASVMNLESNGVIVKKYEIEESPPSVLGQYETHRITFKPIRGSESTVFFKIPKIDENGEFYAAGVKQRLRKQRTEVPIKKVSPIRVALTSSYTKLFINRSERKQFDPYTYLTDFIRDSFMDESEDRLIKKLVLAPVYKNDQKTPYILGHLGRSYSHIHFKDFNIVLDLEEAKKHVNDEQRVTQMVTDGFYPCGFTNKAIDPLVSLQPQMDQIVFQATISTTLLNLAKSDEEVGSYITNPKDYQAILFQGKEVGIIRIDEVKNDIKIGSLFIHPKFRGLNIGPAALAKAVESNNGSGYGFVSPDNKSSKRMLQKAGFEFEKMHPTEKNTEIWGRSPAKRKTVSKNTKQLLVCDMDNVFYVYHNQDKQDRLGPLNQLLDIPDQQMPKPFSDIRILGKIVPLGVVLAFYLGITDLLRLLKVTPMVLPAKKRVILKSNQWRLRFNDIQLIFSNLNEEQTLLLGGFLFYEKFIKSHPYEDFNYENIYLLLLEFRGLQVVHLKEIGLLRDIFLDPITKEVLGAMNEPTEYIPLLLKANQLLTDVSHPELTDANYTRIRGYDRVPSLIYRNLASSIRAYRFKSGVRTKVELDPYAVWNTITQDNTAKIVEDTNPIMNLKEQEAVTLLGLDGLSKETIAVMQRNYTKNDMGLISELTVDSGDVGINTFLTSDPKLGSLRGTVDPSNVDYVTDPAKLLSTSALLAPGSDTDD